MNYTQVKIDDNLHNKMKELASKKGGKIVDEYRKAIEEHIKKETEKDMVLNTGLDNYINKRVSKAEDHLASMMARTGMDTSMALMGVVFLLQKLLKVEKADVMRKLRHDGYTYFVTEVQKDKEKKKNENNNESK